MFYCWCHSDSASVLLHLHFCHTCSLCRVELVVQFPARGSTQVLVCLFPGVLWLWHFLYRVSVHIQCQASIYTLSLCRGHSWRVRLAKQETLTPPGHLVSPLVCRGPWMSTVVFYCWCHSDCASVLLYSTINLHVTLLIELIKTRIYKCSELISTCNEKMQRNSMERCWNDKLRQTIILDKKYKYTWAPQTVHNTPVMNFLKGYFCIILF